MEITAKKQDINDQPLSSIQGATARDMLAEKLRYIGS